MLFLGFFIMVINSHATLSETIDNQYYCPDYHPQRTLDLEQIMGLWQVTEIVYHKRIEAQGFYNFVHSRVCPTVHIGQETRSDLRLVWNERHYSLYYKIRLNDPTSPGFWLASGPHNDTVLDTHYQMVFNGVIQVMKAVGTHVVLTFCTRQSSSESQLFSVLLTREFEYVAPGTMRSVNKMLERRGLESVFIKRTCSGASKIVSALFLQMIVIATWRFLL